ncbi:MAG: PBP1A family penicillin-binding protein [Thiohalocapsa sp.]
MTIVRKLRRAVRGLLLVLAVGVGAAAAFVIYCMLTLPVAPSQPAEGSPGAVMFASGAGVPFAERGVYHGDKLTGDHLPTDLANAVVAIEDARFYQHYGIDMRSMLRAAGHDLLGHGPLEGASTITQQLARLLYLSPDRNMRRKVQEIVLALWLDARLSKKEILARYLNRVYFGAGAYGADAAARRYFGKPAADLDLAQSAMLAGLIRAPSQLAPNRNLNPALRRERLVLDAMVQTGMIDKKRAAAAKAEPVKLAVAPETEPNDNYFVDTADAEVKRLVGAVPVDLAVTTTFDPRLQDAAERTVQRWLSGEGAKRHVSQAALLAMAPDGAILAMVGGRDYSQSQFNRVTQARRQPGSLFKIFVYLAALGSGYTPDSTVTDQPVTIGDWQPKNYEDRYLGPVSLKTAFAQSLNSVAAQLVQALGIDRVIAMARSLGVQSELPAVPSLALGSAEVTLLEMTRAMDTIATDTTLIEPYTVRSIRSDQSAPLYSRPTPRVLRPAWQAAWAPMMRLLEAVVSEGTGKAAHLDRRAAGKTGTTDDYRDAWFVGFTTDLVVGVWVGNDDNSPMDRVAGGDIPARIWHDFVEEAEHILATPAAAGATAAGGLTGSTLAPSAAAARPRLAAAAAAQLPSALHGRPTVIDSGTLLLHGVRVHLDGVKGLSGAPARQLASYIGDREVSCEPAEDGQGGQSGQSRDRGKGGGARYHCKLGEYDLSEAVLLNGAGRLGEDADARLRAFEDQARTAARGIWRR